MPPNALDLAKRHHSAGRLAEAQALYQSILANQPQNPDALHMLGVLAFQSGGPNDALELIRRAIRIDPARADFHSNLGLILADFDPRQAIESFRKALQLNPDLAQAGYNLAILLLQTDQPKDVISTLRRALQANPNYPEAQRLLAASLQRNGQLDEAVAAYRQAILLDPNFADAYTNLGHELKDQGLLDKAIAAYRQAVAVQPDCAATHSCLLYALSFQHPQDTRAVADELRRWNRQHVEPLRKFIQPHHNDPTPDRRLRIGYVSPDFRTHPVGRFMLPLLASHDHTQFEIFAYSAALAPDPVTAQLQRHADVWHDVNHSTDEELAQLIRQDQIDILADLTMHMGLNRLLAFARKPAPVQVTYLAYPGTTGVETIDYRLTDPHLDPRDENAYSEHTVRLPQTYWCYQPLYTIDPGPLPAESDGVVTFACFNNFCKISPATWDLWQRILQSVPRSRLVISCPFGSQRDRLRGQLAAARLDPDRLVFAPLVSTQQYFQNYQRADIALDPIPYGGGTTTCDALWMGVPVVTLAGDSSFGRLGVSILTNLGLPELIAKTAQDYVRIAAELANNIPRLRQFRSTLRDQMLASPLMDAPRFARDIEAAYRQMWRTWTQK